MAVKQSPASPTARTTSPQGCAPTRDQRTGPGHRALRAPSAAGRTDAGRGAPAEGREKVCGPLYTTKEPGRGTGWGVAVVARAVDAMGGVVWVDTAREGGAAFKMFFPSLCPAYSWSMTSRVCASRS